MVLKSSPSKTQERRKINRIDTSRNLKAQGLYKKYNLSTLDINEKLKHLDVHNSKYGQVANNKSSSFMKMMQKLEQNMHNNMPKGLTKDLIIEKRRLVSSQEQRFCAIKVSKYKDNKGNVDIKAQIESDIKNYKNTIYNKEDKNTGMESRLLNADYDLKGDSTLNNLQHESQEFLYGEYLINDDNCYAGIKRMKIDHSPFNLNSQKDKDKSSSQSLEFEQGNGPNKNKADINLQLPQNKRTDNNKPLKSTSIDCTDLKPNSKSSKRNSSSDINKFQAIPNRSLGSMTYRDDKECTSNSKIESFSPFAMNSSIIRRKNKLIINPEGPYAFLPDFLREANQRSQKNQDKDLKDILEHRKLYSNSRDNSGVHRNSTPKILVSNIQLKNKDLDGLSNSVGDDIHKIDECSPINHEYHKIIKVDNIKLSKQVNG